MKECKFYKRDEQAFEEHISYMRHCAAEGYTYQPDEDPELPCYAFCKHFQSGPGFMDEILYYCEHPDNSHVIMCDCENYDNKYDEASNDEIYMRNSTAGDYGPSNPWDAPGMSIKDFI